MARKALPGKLGTIVHYEHGTFRFWCRVADAAVLMFVHVTSDKSDAAICLTSRLGAYGRDYPVERFYRDNRLNPIHEGTHAIHGIDLLGRKVRIAEGAALMALVAEIEATIDAAEGVSGLNGYAGDLLKAVSALSEATEAVLASEDLNLGLANATLYLDAFGHVVIAWMWLRQAMAAREGRANGNEGDVAFYEGKLAACRYFYRYELPKVYAQLRLVGSVDNTCLSVSVENFVGT